MNPEKNENFNNPPPYSAPSQPPPAGQPYPHGAYPAASYPQAAYPQGAYPNTSYPQQPQYPVQGGYAVAGTATTQPVYAYQPQTVPGVIVGQPDNHAGLAWFSCLCCFWPLGLVAIIKSNEVNNAYQQGDINRANLASRSARQFSLIAIGLGVASWIFAVIFIILYIAVFAAASTRYYN